MRKMISILVVGICLAACANTLEGAKKDLGGGSPPAQTSTLASPPVSAQTAPTAVEQRRAQSNVVGDFPTSLLSAQGSAWKTLHADSYKGDFITTCGLLDLSKAECDKFAAMRDSGHCTVAKVRNGVVFDRLGYSRGNGHHVQHRALVALSGRDENPDALVCDLGDKIVGIIHKCGNPYRIDRPKAPLVAAVPAPAVQGCPIGRTVTMHIWPSDLPPDILGRAIPLVQAVNVRTVPQGPAFSNRLGGELRKRARNGEFTRHGKVTVDTYLVDGRTGTQRFLHTMTIDREASFEIPAKEIEGNHLRQIVRNQNVLSPTVLQSTGLRELWTYWPEWGAECLMNNHVLHGEKKGGPTS